VRLRLARDEVDAIAAGHSVASRTHFPGGAVLEYRLQPGSTTLDARFQGGAITIHVPMAIASHWALSPTEVAIKGVVAQRDSALQLLIEKDFECLDPRDGESQGNRFPNPAAQK
jgi:hypothetical protein